MGTPKKSEGHQYPILGTLNNLTFDGFVDKHLDNFDHDKLVKNIVSAEKCRTTQNSSSSSSSSSSPPIFIENRNASNKSRNYKTIDEIWNGMVSQENANITTRSSLNPAEMINKGELTLDEFLTHNGAINAATKQPIDHDMVRQWQQQQGMMAMPVQAVMGPKFEVSENIFDQNKVMDLGYFDATVQTVEMADKSLESHEAQTENKRVFTDKLMAKTIERRQRRMIKNRESAARSRARKQAYINQLQHNLLQLQTMNNWLKKRKGFEMLLDSSSTSAPRYQLRRTSSNTF